MNASNTSRTRLLGLLVALGAAAPASAQLIADSRADFSDVQGFNGWTYGFYDGDPNNAWDPDDFEPLVYFDTAWRRVAPGPGGYWTAVERLGGHPNSINTSGGRIAEDNWAVRRWTSDRAFIAVIHGSIWDHDPTPNHGDGVTGIITINGRTQWTVDIDNGDSVGAEYQIVACLEPGDIVDFVIAPRMNDYCDDTGFISTVHTIIERQPESLVVCPNGEATLSVVTVAPAEFQWRFDGKPILGANEATYTIPAVGPQHVGQYDCVISIPDCGSMTTAEASIDICYADYNCDALLNSQDFFDFIHDFLDNNIRADYDNNGVINSQDYFDFLTAFFTGCRN